MIKFFRKIRQKSILDNKFSKYILYATGEIILVVIGILIALQLNIISEKNKEQTEARDFIVRLLDEVRININHVDNEIQTERNQEQSSLKILNLFNEPIKPHKSNELDSLIFIMLSANTMSFNLGTLTEGQNTGKISLIKSDELRLKLYNLPSMVQFVRKTEDIGADDVNDQLASFLYENYNYRNMDNRYSRDKGLIGDTKFTDFNNQTLLNSQQFENLVDNRFYNNHSTRIKYEILKAELQQIETLIQKEISNN